MDIGSLLASAIDSVVQRTIRQTVIPWIKELLNIISGSEQITGLPFFEPLHRSSQVLGIALLTGVAMWSLCKAIFAFTGIEADDPAHIGMQLMAALFFTWYSKDILLFVVDLNGTFINSVIISAAYGGNPQLLTHATLDGALNLLLDRITSNTVEICLFSLEFIPIMYIVFRLVVLLLKIFRRSVLIAFLVITSPIAFACSISRSTRGVQTGFFRVFAGNLVMHLVQGMGLIAISLYASDAPWTAPRLLGMYGILYVVDRLEDIIRDMSLGLGFAREGDNFGHHSRTVLDLSGKALAPLVTAIRGALTAAAPVP
ncbi:MAG: hypothetical protein FWF06_00930 [Symbiobacteriaceae bacterium]|nr:hypothetical protein [Symbiobacteriaceae bacterium]